MPGMDQDPEEYVSKSQLKRMAHEAQAMGERLVELPDKTLKEMELPESLYDAIVQARGMKSHGARKRQLQFIGKLMRDIDTTPIADALARFDARHHSNVAQFHALEQWRDQLVENVDDAVGRFIADHPNVDIQQFRTLVRNAQREHKSQKNPPKYQRQLFQFLKDHHNAQE